MNCSNCGATLAADADACAKCGFDVASGERTRATPALDTSSREVLGGQWQLDKKLGQGGMGTVFLAHDLSLGRKVAIKVLAASLTDNEELVGRFEREARMMARLDHPNLVPVYAVGRRDKTPFIVMKFLDGQSLGDYLVSRKRVGLHELLPLVKQLTEGLQFVHDNAVVHRDLKPANVFVSPSGHVTLLDLGVARDTEQNHTRTGMIVGTPRYMAPEQILGQRVDHTADLYSLATVVFELLAGTPVFEGESDFSLMKQHVDQLPPDVETLAEVPAGVNAVLQKALAKLPADRYQSARAFYSALEDASSGAPKPVTTAPTAKVVRSRATPTPVARKAEHRSKPPSNAVYTRNDGPKVQPQPPVAVIAQDRRTDPEKPIVPEAGDDDLAAIAPRSSMPLIAVLLGLVIAILVGVLVWKPWASPDPEPTVVAEVTPPPKPPIPVPEPVKVKPPPAPEPVAVPTPTPKPVVQRDPPPAPAPAPRQPVPAPAPAPRQPVVNAPPPAPAPRLKAGGVDAPVTFLFRVKGQNAAAFVDVDGIRQRSTPFQMKLTAGRHNVSFVSDGRDPVKREVVVVGGEPQKVLVEVPQ